MEHFITQARNEARNEVMEEFASGGNVKDDEEVKDNETKPDEKENEKENEKEEEKEKEKNTKKEKKPVKEGFDTFAHTAEILRKGWRLRNMPSTLQPYYGPIRGFNCGEYSEFSYDKVEPPCLNIGKCNSEWKYPSDCPGDYIFPGRISYKGDVPLEQYFLDEQQQVLDAAVDEGNKLFVEKLSPRAADSIARPSYMYHRGDGTMDSILHPGNRF
jgi:hypothetical protein